MGGSKGTQINTVNNGRTGTANIAGSKTGVAINTFNNDGTFNIKLMNLVMPATNATSTPTPSYWLCLANRRRARVTRTV